MKTATKNELLAIISTYEGLIAQCNDGEGADLFFDKLEEAQALLAAMAAS